MLKRNLRKKYSLLRADVTQDEISRLSIQLVNCLVKLPIWDFLYFHIFLSIVQNKEVDTLPLLTLLQGKDKNIVVPKVAGTKTMKHYLLTDTTLLKPNKWNIPEPTDGIEVPTHRIDVVFVPLLAFDLLGNRVGYGSGYYDTFLNRCRPETLKIGISFFEPEVEPIEDIHGNDVRLDHCVTPEKTYTFGTSAKGLPRTK